MSDAPARDWVASIGPAHVGRFENRDEGMLETDKAAKRLVGIGWIVNEKTRERWMRNPETGTWRAFVAAAKPKRRAPLDPEKWPQRKWRADIDG